MSVAENLLFGTPRRPDFQLANLARNPEVVGLLREVGLLDDLYAAGAKVAALMVEMFADVAPDSDLFEQYSFISADDLPEFRGAGTKIDKGKLAAISDDDKARLLALTFRMVASRHRLGVIDEGGDAQRIVAARARFSERYKGRDDMMRVLRAGPIQPGAFDPGQHPVRAHRVRAGECADADQRDGARHCDRTMGMQRRAGAARPGVRSRQRRFAAFLLASGSAWRSRAA